MKCFEKADEDIQIKGGKNKDHSAVWKWNLDIRSMGNRLEIWERKILKRIFGRIMMQRRRKREWQKDETFL